MNSSEERNQHICLAHDVDRLIVETDEDNPIPILVIDRSEEPIKIAEGYRVRFKPTEN